MDLIVNVDENGVPSVQVSSMLDWLDMQINAAEAAKLSASEGVAIFLDHSIDRYTNLKTELSKSTMEAMDVSAAS